MRTCLIAWLERWWADSEKLKYILKYITFRNEKYVKNIILKIGDIFHCSVFKISVSFLGFWNLWKELTQFCTTCTFTFIIIILPEIQNNNNKETNYGGLDHPFLHHRYIPPREGEKVDRWLWWKLTIIIITIYLFVTGLARARRHHQLLQEIICPIYLLWACLSLAYIMWMHDIEKPSILWFY